jgi:hypothetical protein
VPRRAVSCVEHGNVEDGQKAPALVAYTADEPDGEVLLVTADQANRGTFENGRYYFSCLQFKSLPKGLVRVQFAALDESSSPARRLEGINRGTTLRTGFVTVSSVVMSSSGIRFAERDSHVVYSGQATSAVVNVALPQIVIEILDSLGNFDASDSSTVISATVSHGTLEPVGSQITASKGRAVFGALQLSSISESTVLTFTALGSSLIGGKFVSTGKIRTTTLPVPDYELAFDGSGASTANAVLYPLHRLVVNDTTTLHATVLVRDSAHQPVPAVTGAVRIELQAPAVVLDGTSSILLAPESVAAAQFAFRITAYREGFSATTPVMLYFNATTADGLVRGKVIVAGPITVGALSQGSSACSANLVAKATIAEFRMLPNEFTTSTVLDRLAFLLGIAPSRIVIDRNDLKEIARIDHSTLVPWRGTKARITFTDPSATSTNRKTSAELAADFVALRPGCDGKDIGLQAVYYEEDDRSCDATKFEASEAETKKCVVDGEQDECACYSTGVIGTWGKVCAEDPSVRPKLEATCKRLVTCRDAEIQNVCDTILPSAAFDLVWLWATLGGVGFFGLLVGGLALKHKFRGKRRMALGKRFND